jgi:hypothetical protein
MGVLIVHQRATHVSFCDGYPLRLVCRSPSEGLCRPHCVYKLSLYWTRSTVAMETYILASAPKTDLLILRRAQ